MENKITHTYTAGGVVVNNKGEVVVVSQGGRTWSLPKGHIEKMETPLEAATREIYEESGLSQLELVREFPSYERYKIGKNGGEDQTELRTMTLFLFKTNQVELKPNDPDNPEARWIPKEKVAELLTHPRDKEFFLGIIKEI